MVSFPFSSQLCEMLVVADQRHSDTAHQASVLSLLSGGRCLLETRQPSCQARRHATLPATAAALCFRDVCFFKHRGARVLRPGRVRSAPKCAEHYLREPGYGVRARGGCDGRGCAAERGGGDARRAAAAGRLPGGLGDPGEGEREQRAGLPVPPGLREPEDPRGGRREVRAVSAGLLQGAAAERQLRGVRGELVDAARGQRERARLRVRRRTLAGAGRGGVRAVRGGELQGRGGGRSVFLGACRGHTSLGRGVRAVSAGSLLPGGSGGAGGVPRAQLGGGGARGGGGVPVRDGVPGVAGAGGRWAGLELRARMPGVRRRGGVLGSALVPRAVPAAAPTVVCFKSALYFYFSGSFRVWTPGLDPSGFDHLTPIV